MAKMKSNEPCPCGSGKKYKNCCGCSDGKQKAINEKLYDNVEELWRDLLILVQLLINFMHEGERIGNPDELDYIPWANDVCNKILVHFLTFIHVCKGTEVPELKLKDGEIKFIDHSSAAIIMRAAFESYLTWYNLFIHPPTNENRNFLLKVWDLGDKRLRAQIPATTEKVKLKVKELTSEGDKLSEEIKLDPFYSQLKERPKKDARNGRWRLGQEWLDLAKNAGFSERFFNSTYKVPSSEAHSGKTSIHRLRIASEQQGPPIYLFVPIQTGLVILGQLINLYPTLFPGFKLNDLPDNIIAKAIAWEKIGKNF